MAAVLFACFRRRMRPAASAVAGVLCVMLFVTCTATAQMTPEQKACCAAMHHDCGEMAIASSCCTGEARDAEGIVATKPIARVAVVATLVAVLSSSTVSIPSVPHVAFEAPASSAGPPGVPTYLFVSSFRI